MRCVSYPVQETWLKVAQVTSRHPYCWRKSGDLRDAMARCVYSHYELTSFKGLELPAVESTELFRKLVLKKFSEKYAAEQAEQLGCE